MYKGNISIDHALWKRDWSASGKNDELRWPTQIFKVYLTLSQTSPNFTCLKNKTTENTVGKGEIARNEQFLLFPVFYPFGQFSAIIIKFKIVVCELGSEESINCCFGKGLSRNILLLVIFVRDKEPFCTRIETKSILHHHWTIC